MAYTLSLAKWTQLSDCLNGRGVTYKFNTAHTDGFMYQTGNPNGLPQYHIHTTEQVVGDNMVFSKLLTKSGNWRNGQEPDLAQYPIAQWAGVCQGMDPSTLLAVNALAACFESLGAVGPN